MEEKKKIYNLYRMPGTSSYVDLGYFSSLDNALTAARRVADQLGDILHEYYVEDGCIVIPTDNEFGITYGIHIMLLDTILVDNFFPEDDFDREVE